MPVLTAKALETDPEGMAFLRSVIRPTFEQEEATSPPVAKVPQQAPEAAPRDAAEAPAARDAAVPAVVD
jgi:hypothetical protein